jgi:FMN-dependent NADH-azoreductase
MSKLLRIDASPRHEGSHSRKLADDLVARWLKSNPNGEVVVRDLAQNPVPHVDQAMLGAVLDPDYRSKPDQVELAALSDELIDELKSADDVLVATPMYNFTVPSVLKAWIDHIVRMEETFSVDEQGRYAGLLSTKRVWIATSSGGVFSEGPLAGFNHLGPYLESLFRFLGVENVESVALENTQAPPEVMQRAQEKATSRLDELFAEA